MELIKEKHNDGEIIYCFPDGEEIKSAPESLADIVNEALYPLEAFLDILDVFVHLEEKPPLGAINIARTLFRSGREEIDENLRFIRENLGHISLDHAIEGQAVPLRTKLGVTFKPVSSDTEGWERGTAS